MNKTPLSTFALFSAWQTFSAIDKLRVLDVMATRFPADVTDAFNKLGIGLQEPTSQDEEQMIKDVNHHLRLGNRVAAIKLLRDHFHTGLKETKYALDYATGHPSSVGWPNLTPQEMKLATKLIDLGVEQH